MNIAFFHTRSILPILLIVGLTACRPSTEPVSNASSTNTTTTDMKPEETAAIAGLQWLNDANPAENAANELTQANAQSRQPNLMAFAGRGISYPGLTKEQLALISDKVGHKIVEGSGDVIYGAAHREMRKKLRSYAIAYNQAIFTAVK
ncbi:MAG: hypothetical protein ACPGVP_10705 [Thiolinea sp.]